MQCVLRSLGRRMNFRLKVFLVFFLFTTLSTLTVSVMLYYVSEKILAFQMEESMRNSLSEVSQSFENDLQQIGDAAVNLSFDPDVIANIQETYPTDSYAYYTVAYDMRRLLGQTLEGQALLKSIYVLSKDGSYFYKSNIDRTYSALELERSGSFDCLQMLPEGKWKLLEGNTLVERSPEATLTMCRYIRNISMTKQTGYVFMNIGMSDIQEYLINIKFGKSGAVGILTPDREALYWPEGIGYSSEMLLESIDLSVPEGTFILNGTIFCYHVSPNSDFIYIAFVPKDEIMAPIASVRNSAMLLVLIGCMVSFLYTVFVSKWMFSPIQTLVRYMSQAGNGNMEIQITEKREDEFGILYTSFNKMIHRIHRLMDKLYLQEALSRKLQLENLQIQLNPHFLYNTLDAIHWAAREGALEDVCQMTFRLSKYFRMNLNDGKQLASVQQISDAIRQYIELQTLRFEGRFQFILEVDERAKELLVLKYIFQPLVENAIVHGLEKKDGSGQCRILFQIEQENLCFTVEDNGVGISDERQKEILSALEQSNRTIENTFALSNINLQIELYYRVKNAVWLESREGVGTKSGFRIPLSCIAPEIE